MPPRGVAYSMTVWKRDASAEDGWRVANWFEIAALRARIKSEMGEDNWNKMVERVNAPSRKGVMRGVNEDHLVTYI